MLEYIIIEKMFSSKSATLKNYFTKQKNAKQQTNRKKLQLKVKKNF